MDICPVSLIPDIYHTFNIALQQLGRSVIHSIKIDNPNDFPLQNLTLTVSSDVDFFDPESFLIPSLPASDTLLAENLFLKYHPDYLISLTEAVTANIFFTLSDENGETICSCCEPLDIMAYNEWAGGTYMETLPCYITPNHPAIAELMKTASDILADNREDPSLEGYQAFGAYEQNAAVWRIRSLAEAVYLAIQSKKITYSNPPASFSSGQRIRTPDMVLNDRLGTCIDMSILYASVLEAMQLNPVLFLCEGHCYAGVWLTEQCAEEPLITDPALAVKYALSEQILLPVECTCLCRNEDGLSAPSFYAAFNAASKTLSDTKSFQAVIDITSARIHGILPLPLRVINGTETNIIYEASARYPLSPKGTVFLPVTAPSDDGSKAITRPDVWENKLLDLSSSNRMMNLRGDRSMVPFFYGNLTELGERLLNLESFEILPSSRLFPDYEFEHRNPYELFISTGWDRDGITDYYNLHQLCSFYGEETLKKTLSRMAGESRTLLEESGAACLYLTLGTILQPQAAICTPVILIPVELSGLPRVSDYHLQLRGDEVCLNPTLLEMLRRNYGLDLHEDACYTGSSHTFDFSYTIALIEKMLRGIPELIYINSCCLTILSGDRMALWKDIHKNRDLLTENPLIQGLVRGSLESGLSDNRKVRTAIEQQKIYLPLPLDSSQIHAVKRALCGSTFMLQGPPGTGKSQVITAIIANALALGKRVLFVAEKGAALRVVKERLTRELKLNPYLLQISGEENDLSAAISLFSEAEKAASSPEAGESAYEKLQNRFLRSGLSLDCYLEKICRPQKCGLSLRDLINRYLSIEAADLISFDREHAALWNADDLEKMDELLQKLFDISAICAVSSSKRNMTAYRKIINQCRACGLSDAVGMLKAGRSAGEVMNSYRKGLSYALILSVIEADPYLTEFSGTELDLIVKEFRKLDGLLMEASRQEIAHQMYLQRQAVLQDPELAGEWNLLKKIASSGETAPSVYKITELLPNLLFRLYPCFLMSPDAAAQYLPFRKDLFDLVIFDEASRIETCRAVSALARGKNAVIAGDVNQLPPNAPLPAAAFEKSLELEDMENILEDCRILSLPCETLKWHYRSRHESLIAFCNRSYYKNRIYTFPSADKTERCVIYRNVGGVFKNSANRQEARAILEELKSISSESLHSEQHPSIGIIAFSKIQKDIILTQIEKACKGDPEFDHFIHDSDGTELFVKDLENVQGDERDIILFSVAYGPGEDGKAPSYRFGKIDGPDGWKRLNVAFSRARRKMIIFSSIHGDDIPITSYSSRGKKEIKAFLNYAENGMMETAASDPRQQDPDISGICSDICSRLEAHGYLCTRDVGSSGLRIDAAVSDPSAPDTYRLGILIDGFSYGATARDRYITPQQILTRRGWRLCHIWTPDWWADPDGETERLLNLLDTGTKPDQ